MSQIKHVHSIFRIKNGDIVYEVTFSYDRKGRPFEVSLQKQGKALQWIDNSDEKYRPCADHALLIVMSAIVDAGCSSRAEVT